MQLVTSANSVWPSTAAPSVAYAQVGDLVEMLFHSNDSAFTTCGFCQTVNREGATRCRACGGSLRPCDDLEPRDADDEASEDEEAGIGGRSIDKRDFSDLPALRSVLMLVLLPPMLMFLGFGAWNELRASLGDAEAVELPSRSSIDSVFAAPNVGVPPARRPDELRPRPPLAKSQVPLHAEGDADADEGTAVGTDTDIAATDSEREVQKATPNRVSRSVPLHQAARVQQSNPIAVCNGYSFIARAVCVNKSCADPRAAQHAQCRQANRQRRIDENRRNPVLMG